MRAGGHLLEAARERGVRCAVRRNVEYGRLLQDAQPVIGSALDVNNLEVYDSAGALASVLNVEE